MNCGADLLIVVHRGCEYDAALGTLDSTSNEE